MTPRLLAVLLVLTAAGPALAQGPVPRLEARVTDLTGTFSAAQKSALEGRLAAFEAKKGAQLAVLLVPTTKPEPIEPYAARVFEQWKLGRKGVDDGVLVVVAKDDRRLRIEVGYGLEGAIPDAVARRVIDEIIVPRFRAGDFHGGVSAGVDRLIRLIEGEKLPPPARSSPPPVDAPSTFLLLVLSAVLGEVMNAVFGRRVGATTVGLAVGAATWYLIGLEFAIVAALIAFVLALVVLSLRAGHAVGRGRGGSSSGGSSGGGGWSSGGGGGFSGGGGSSGGGGASGSW
jgi:uncharacterized protein